MGFAELVLVAVGLSMDAFAVAVCKGLGMRRVDWKASVVLALFFGGFQALMPLIGWALGSQFLWIIEPVDHWIAFVLLGFIGGKMLLDALRDEGGADAQKPAAERGASLASEDHDAAGNAADGCAVATSAAGEAAVNGCPAGGSAAEKNVASAIDLREYLMLAIATSIDALALGISFAALNVAIVPSVVLIGVITFCLTLVGVAVGNRFGARYERPASIVGGIVLILIGLKILLEHLGILMF